MKKKGRKKCPICGKTKWNTKVKGIRYQCCECGFILEIGSCHN